MFNTFLDAIPYILIPILIALVDFITVTRSKIAEKKFSTTTNAKSGDFMILVPIFGDMSYLHNVNFLKKYPGKVILCTTTRETPEFNREINRIARKYKFKIFKSRVPMATGQSKPNPWLLFTNTLHGSKEIINREIVRDEIIKESFGAVKTKYCVFVDGDTIARMSLYKFVGMMDRKKYAIASVRVLVSRTKTVMEKLQDLEYRLAMDARKIYPWLTSGAGVVARTDAIKHIMAHHSLFFSGGDIEIGKLAGLLKYKTGHLPMNFYTDVPATFSAWFRQRMAWFGGGFRHAIINFHQFSWKHPLFFLYTTILVYGLTPIRWYEIIVHWQVLPLVIGIYLALVFIFHWKQKSWHFFLFPFYALTQVMIILPLGVYAYFKMALYSDNVGLIGLREN